VVTLVRYGSHDLLQSRNTMKMIFNTILGAGNPMGAARLLRERP